MKLYNQIAEAVDNLERARNLFLVKAGWKYTCDTPGSIYLWQKQLPDGRVVLIQPKLAVRMEEALNPNLLDGEEDENTS